MRWVTHELVPVHKSCRITGLDYMKKLYTEVTSITTEGHPYLGRNTNMYFTITQCCTQVEDKYVKNILSLGIQEAIIGY